MSAKQAYQKTPAHLPEIPPEVWLHILRLATSIPDSVESTPLLLERGPNRTSMAAICEIKRYRKSLATKKRIVRVCSTWNAWTTPFLYEHIVITKARTLKSLLDPLSHTVPFQCQASTVERLGALTKRLTICMPACEWYNVKYDKKLQPIDRLFEFTPNLTTLVVISSIASQISLAIPSNVEYLCWTGDYPPLDAEAWSSFMDNHPNIKFLNSFSITIPPSSKSFRGFLGPWYSIHELCIDQSYDAWAWDQFATMTPMGTFPNLKKVHLGPSFNHFRGFLALHGRYIVSLHVARLSPSSRSKDADRLEAIRKHCPNLRELLWTWYCGGIVKPGDLQEPLPIEILGIETTMTQFTKAEGNHFFQGILVWFGKDTIPMLRTLHLFSERNIKHLRQNHAKAFDGFLNTCGSLGILVEDHFHVPLNSPKPI